MVLLSISMFLLPAILAWIAHVFFLKEKMGKKKKILFFMLYIILINLCTYVVSYLRGVREINFTYMTLSYRLKYLALGCVFGWFFLCIQFFKVNDRVIYGQFQKWVLRFREWGNECIQYAAKFFTDTKRYFPYAVRSAKADLRAEVANSFLDWLWWLIEPFCMMLIYSFIFGTVMKSAEKYFPIFIFLGLATFNFFSRGVNGSVEIIRANRAIITKVYLPKYILVISKMLVNGFKMMVSFGVVVVMMIFFKVPVTVNIIYFLPVIAVLFLFTFGLGTILMHYGVYVSDLSYIIGILLNMLMYMSGIFYSMNKVPAPLGEILKKYNPMAFLISCMRNAILYGQMPDWELLGMWTIISLILGMVGIVTIYRNENAYVKVI